jgi:hypothetical protein
MAAALRQLRALHVMIPAEIADFNLDYQRSYLRAWLWALSGITQIQRLSFTEPSGRFAGLDLQPVLLQEDALRALCKLQQLQQLTLQGWVWGVSPVFVIGLELGLQQLTSIRLGGCGGWGRAAEQQKAAIREGMERVAAGMRPGLQLVYTE